VSLSGILSVKFRVFPWLLPFFLVWLRLGPPWRSARLFFLFAAQFHQKLQGAKMQASAELQAVAAVERVTTPAASD